MINLLYQNTMNASFYILPKLRTTWLTKLIYFELKLWNCLIVSKLLMFFLLPLSFQKFSSFAIHQLHSLVGCYVMEINSFYILVTCFTLLKTITSSNKYYKNNISRTIFIKIIIIKVNILNVYTIKASAITKECNNIL